MQQISIENLAFMWPEGKGFTDVNLQLQRGDFVIIQGPSGMGKSTLLRVLVRLEEAQKGRILFYGEDIATMQANILRQKIALVTQTPQLGASTIDEALRLPFCFALNAQYAKPSEAEIYDAMAKVRLADISLQADTQSLSLGQQLRVALVRHILLKPEILLLDEPTSALDAESRLAVEQCIEALHASSMTILMITHTEYVPTCLHRVFWLENGTLSERTTQL